MRWVTLLLPRLSPMVTPMTLFIIACIVGGLAYLFLKVGPARGRTFIRAVAFLDALKAGQSVERANATIASPGLTEHPEMIQFAKSVLHARGGKQLPSIAEARRRGMIEPK